MGLLEGLTSEVVTVKRKTSSDLAGDPVRGTTLTMPARVERNAGRMSSPDGEELFFNARIFVEPPNTLELTDLVFFSEDDTASAEAGRRLTRVDQVRDLDGEIDHVEGWF